MKQKPHQDLLSEQKAIKAHEVDVGKQEGVIGDSVPLLFHKEKEMEDEALTPLHESASLHPLQIHSAHSRYFLIRLVCLHENHNKRSYLPQ